MLFSFNSLLMVVFLWLGMNLQTVREFHCLGAVLLLGDMTSAADTELIVLREAQHVL